MMKTTDKTDLLDVNARAAIAFGLAIVAFLLVYIAFLR